MSAEERAAIVRTKEIDRRLKEECQRAKKDIKLLLLGEVLSINSRQTAVAAFNG